MCMVAKIDYLAFPRKFSLYINFRIYKFQRGFVLQGYVSNGKKTISAEINLLLFG